MRKHTLKTIESIKSGLHDKSIRFDDLVAFLCDLDFHCRIRGDHHIFTHDGVEEIINLQPSGSMAKPYQVRQVRSLLNKYAFGG